MIEIPSKNISKLDLSNQDLTHFPTEIFALKNLKKLNLSGNKIKLVPKEIESLKNLELLDLSNNSISNLYSKICSLKKLQVLNINKNKIKTLPIQIQLLEKLKILQIANNQITHLPSTISKLQSLQEINLSQNKFESFPEEVLKIKSLKKVWLNNLPLKNFPKKEIIESLINLESIYCFGNKQDSKSLDRVYLHLTRFKGNIINKLTEMKHTENVVVNKVQKVINSSNNSKIVKNQIFISYSHNDKLWLQKVQTNLKVLEHENHDFHLWDDTKIKAGDKWKKEIEKALANAGIAILIISTDFLASDFVRNDELPTLLRNAEEKGTRILPIIVRPCLFTKSKNLSVFQAVNNPKKPLSSLRDSEIENELVKLSESVLEILESN